MPEEKKELEKITQKLKLEETLKLLFEKMPLGAVVVDRESTILYENPAMAQIIGVPKGETSRVLGQNLLKFPPVVKAGIAEKLKDLFKGKELRNLSFTYTSLYQKTSEIIVDGIPIFNEAGQMTYALILVRDVTDEKKLQEKLIESEVRYRRLFESAKDGILIIDYDTEKIIDANPFIEQLLKYAPQELLGKKVWEIGFLQDLERSQAAFSKLKKEGYVRYEDLPLQTKTGEKVWVEFISNVYLVNNIKIIQCNIRDISERKKMEEKVNLEHQQFLSIFDSIEEPIYITDPKTYEILYANKALKNTFGEDLLGKKCYETFQGYHAPCDFCTNKYIFDKNLGKTYTWDFQNKVNKRWYHCIDRAIQWPDGRWVRYEMAIDITERKKAEEELKKHTEELEKMNKFLVGRELDMIELKKEVNRLLAELGRSKKYEV